MKALVLYYLIKGPIQRRDLIWWPVLQMLAGLLASMLDSKNKEKGIHFESNFHFAKKPFSDS